MESAVVSAGQDVSASFSVGSAEEAQMVATNISDSCAFSPQLFRVIVSPNNH
jgi:hypothetical protein